MWCSINSNEFALLPSSSSSCPSHAHLHVAPIATQLHHRTRGALIFIVAPVARSCSCRARSALIFIVAPIARSSSCRAHPTLIFIVAPIACSSSSLRPSRAQLYRCAHRVLIFIVAPVARSSSSLRPPRAHLHVAPMACSSSCRTHSALIFIVTPIVRSSPCCCQKPFNLEGVDFNVDSRCKVILDLLK